MRPRIPGLLRKNANFRRYFIGQSVSLLGDQVSTIALPLTAVLALHATPEQMGALTTAYLLPNLLLSLHAGVWVDRSGRRRQVMLVADVIRGLLTATIPIAFVLGDLTWDQLYVVSFLLGCASVFFYVSYGGFFQTIVEREDYIEANTLLNGTRGFSFLAGTSLGGVLVQLLRGPYALALDAVSFLWSALFLRRVDAADPPGAPRESGGIGTGLRWIRNNPVMRAELLGVATINLFNFVYWALFLLYASRFLHVGPATIGVVIGVAAAGTLVASALTGRIARAIGVGPAFLIGCFLFPAPLLLVPAARGPHWLVITFLFTAEFLSGLGLMLLDILAGVIQGGLVPAAGPVARLGRVHGRQLRRQAARYDPRRHPRYDDRRPQHDLDRRRRRTAGDGVPAPLAHPPPARRARDGGGLSPLEVGRPQIAAAGSGSSACELSDTAGGVSASR